MKTRTRPKQVPIHASADHIYGKGSSRPARAQQGLQEMANSSGTVKQFRNYQAMADAHTLPASKEQGAGQSVGKPVLHKKTGNILSPGATPFAAVVQAKRSRPADAELTGLIDEKGVLNEDIGKKISSEIPAGESKKRADAVWTFLDSSYEGTLARGTRLYGELQGKIAAYKDRSRKAALVEELKKKDAKNEEIFDSSYATDMAGKGGKFFMESTGKDPEIKKGEARYDEYADMKKKKTRSIDYENTAVPDKGQLIANQNFNDKDLARFQPKGALKNSEILWNQYRKAAIKAATAGGGDEVKVDAGKVAKDLKKLELITRQHILNEETLATIYMAGANNTKIGAKKEHAPASGDFLALLGTPNGNSSAYILMDHMHDLEKNIKSIDTGGTDTNIDMNIKFKKI